MKRAKLYRVEITRTVYVVATSADTAEDVAVENEEANGSVQTVASEVQAVQGLPPEVRGSLPWLGGSVAGDGPKRFTVAQWALLIGALGQPAAKAGLVTEGA